MTARFKQVFAAIAVSVFLLPAVAIAQSTKKQTLADIRQDLTVLFVEMKRLNRELSTTSSSALAIGRASVNDRIASVEGELRRLTGKIEQLEFRINSIVKDGTNRIGDLEFRLVELEGGDGSKLSESSTLGRGAAPVGPAVAQQNGGSDAQDVQLAMGEQADFDAAIALLSGGDNVGAVEQFGIFTQNYPGSPLEGQARLKQGFAHDAGSNTREAARAYLEAYSLDPSSDIAPEALFRLGRSLGRLGKSAEACVTLGEVSTRHPGTSAANKAQAEMSALSCT